MYRGSNDVPYRNNEKTVLSQTMRKLWEEHVMWTRSFIVSAAENLQDLPQVTKRLLRNPADFSEVLSRYYGYEKAKRFEYLLTEHLTIAAKLVNDAKSGDMNAVEEDRKDWYHNADELADFLAGLNPHWSRREWRSLLYDHLKMTEDEAIDRLSGQFAADIADYDEIENQALRMADYMAEGIQKQFHIG